MGVIAMGSARPTVWAHTDGVSCDLRRYMLDYFWQLHAAPAWPGRMWPQHSTSASRS